MEEIGVIVRLKIPDEFLLGAVQIKISHLVEYLKDNAAALLQVYCSPYGQTVDLPPYTPKFGYIYDPESRKLTHLFKSEGIERRDKLLEFEPIKSIVLPIQRITFTNEIDAKRCLCIPITSIREIDPIDPDQFKSVDGKELKTVDFKVPVFISHMAKTLT